MAKQMISKQINAARKDPPMTTMTPMTTPMAVDLTEPDLEATAPHVPEETTAPAAEQEVTFNAQLTEVQEYKTELDASFTPVNRKKKATPATAISSKLNRFGIIFVRKGKIHEVAIHPNDLRAIFSTIADEDQEAIIIPHDNQEKHAIKVSHINATSDNEIRAMLNVVSETWGTPEEKLGKLSFSVYLASDVIGPNLQALRNNPHFMRLLDAGDFRMAYHALEQTKTQQVGYFLGKSSDHT